MKTGTIYCEYSGAVREAFRNKGWDMLSCDLLPAEDGSPNHIQGDALDVVTAAKDDRFAGVHWPCTFFANSSVRWMYGGKGTAIDPARREKMNESAVGLAKLLRPLIDTKTPFYFENPVMHGMARDEITRLLPEFANLGWQSVQPWHFGTWETKRTCLWLHLLPPLVPLYHTAEECRIALNLPEYIEKDGAMVKNRPVAACHLASPGPNRGHERSRTLPTLANAMAEQWGARRKTLTLSGTFTSLPLDEPEE